MGLLFDRFRSNTYENEADVVARFLRPLLTEFLGYQESEIIPELNMPALRVAQNRGASASSRELLARPDILLTVDNGATYAGACDAKHPTEPLDEHLEQLRAYANALRSTNLLLITNGTATHLLHGNALLIEARSLEELDLHFDRLLHLFGRERVLRLPEADRLVTLGLPAAPQTLDELERRHRIDVSDFRDYLAKLVTRGDDIALPRALRQALDGSIVCIPPGELHTFHDFDNSSNRCVSYEQLLATTDPTPILLIGESGIGKSVLLQQFCADQARRCLSGASNAIPVPVRLASCSSVRTIESIVLDQLAAGSSPATAERLRKLMSEGRVLLALDGLDEVLDAMRPHVQREIDHLARTFSRVRLVLSTRPLWLPSGLSFLRYNLAALASEQIRKFLALQAGLEPSDILAQIKKLHVDQLATNTLLLSLMSALLKRHRSVPSTKNRLLKEVVRAIELNEEDKLDRGGLGIPWREKYAALGRLALAAVGAGETYSLSAGQSTPILREIVQDLERRRIVDDGIRASQIESELEATGFVSPIDGGHVFWHRAFAEHFAVGGLIEALERGEFDLVALAHETRWSEVLPVAIAGSRPDQNLLAKLATLNVFAAGAALAEAENPDALVAASIIAGLTKGCFSIHSPLRDLATATLSRIPLAAVEGDARRLLETAPLGVQFWALVEIARRNPAGAQLLIESRLDWVEFDDESFRHSSEVLTLALEELGTAWAQEVLLTRWQSHSERWLGAPIANAFTRLAHRGAVTSAISATLLAWFCSDDIPYHTAHDLTGVLAALNTPPVAQELDIRLRRGWHHQKDQSHAFAHVEALQSLMDKSASEVVLCGIEDTTLPSPIRRRFAQALAFSRAPIDTERVRALASAGDPYIRACAIDRLSSFGWTSVEREVKAALGHCQREPNAIDMELLQSRCVEVLVTHDRLGILTQPEVGQDVWSRVTLSILLEGLIARPSSDQVPWLLGLVDAPWDRIRAQSAVALASAGELTRAKKLRDELLANPREDFTESDLLKGLHFIPHEEAVDWAKCTWNASTAARASSSGFMLGQYLDALEHIGSPGARDEMTRVIGELTSVHEVASGLYHLRQLATVDLQGWLLSLAQKHPSSSSVQSWCLELLGLGGDLSSEGFVTERLEHRDALVRRSAFRALMRLHQKEGRLWYGTEEQASGSTLGES
ncbi:MAG TPA: NACHT domain-containing protein [Polyangiaceae bacterium]|jgi:hypothetical protein